MTNSLHILAEQESLSLVRRISARIRVSDDLGFMKKYRATLKTCSMVKLVLFCD